MKNFFTIIASYALLVSCQTYKPITEIPLSDKSWFGNCWKNEGAINFIAHKKDSNPISANMDWVKKDAGIWQWELSDALGRTLYSGEVTHGIFKAKGANDFLKNLEIKKDGYLYWDKTNLDLKWKELHCILNFRLSEEWLSARVFKKDKESKAVSIYKIQDKTREITLVFGKDKLCGEVKGSFLGAFTRKKYDWCFYHHPSKGVLNFENILAFEWNQTEEN